MKTGRSIKPLLWGICLVMLLFTSTSWLTLHHTRMDNDLENQLLKSHRVLSYGVDDRSMALFRIHPQDTRIEIISNLDLPGETIPSDDMELDYSLTVTLLDTNLRPVREEIFWERTRRSSWVDDQTKAVNVAAFYLYEPVIPADSRITSIDLPSNVHDDMFIGIQLTFPEQATASVRVYHHVDMTQGAEINAIKPFGKRFKAKLIRHNLYSHRVKDEELKRSFRDIWRQIPAEDRRGFHYHPRHLFLYDKEIPLLGEAPPLENSIDPQHPIFLPVRGPADLSIVFHTSGDQDLPLNVELHAESAPVTQTTIPVTENTPHTWHFNEGLFLLSLSSPDGAIIWSELELTPETAWITPLETNDGPLSALYRKTDYYRIMPDGSGEPLTVQLPRFSTRMIRPIKIVCRVPVTDPDSYASSSSENEFSVMYVFKNEEHQVIAHGTFRSGTSISDVASYDGSTIDRIETPSMPERFYISVPPDTTYMTFTADRLVDAAFYASIQKREPEIRSLEIGSPDSDTQSNQSEPPRTFCFRTEVETEKSWYYFRPVNHQVLRETGRCHSVRLPAGIYENEPRYTASPVAPRQATTIYPVSDHSKDVIYEEIDPMVSSAASTPGTEYVILHSGESRKVSIDDGDTGGFLFIRYQLQETSEPHIDVMVDGERRIAFRPVSLSGRFELPELEPGDHAIRVDSGSAEDRFFIHQTGNVSFSGNRYRPRSVYRLDPNQTMRLEIHKTDWSSCGINVLAYRPEDSTTPLEMVISASNVKPPASGRASQFLTTPSITFIAPESSSSTPSEPLILKSGKQSAAPLRFYFPLHDDIPPDVYEITVKTNANTPIYLRFFQLDQTVI